MCVRRDHSEASSPGSKKSPVGARSPWRRTPVKPKLSRRIVSGARVNLNRFWHKFEEIHANHLTCLDNEINENLANEIQELGK